MSAESSPIKSSRSLNKLETVEDFESQDTLLKHVDITIVESEKRANGTLHVRDHYTVYLIDLKVTDPDYKLVQSKISTIWRRYTEFEQIHDFLQVTYPHVVIPPLPEKRVLYAWRKSDTTDPEFIERRRAGLENFLLRVASHPRLCFDDQFINFLQQEHGWRETITDSGYLLQAENKLKSLSVSIRLKKPDPEIEGVKNYGRQLETNLGNFLYTRSKIIEKNYALCKLHANYGKLFSEWSVIEKDMGDGLQKAGHYFDSIADSIDSVAEDEEQLADQLKEYLFYASALQQLCANHEALQRALENAHDALNNRLAERTRAAAGKSGLMSRLFGTTDPDIVRDQSTRALDTKIHADREAIDRATRDLEDFTKKATVEIEHFQKQKDKDLHESLVGFITLQVKAAKKNLQAWTQIKECLQNMP
ncbi:sorting nexin-4-like [Vanessa tameamea]|uniref:Sorting nexin-4-like n=1 Tax=Vanessa tameamea TaxID=334116 RepID=A0A8B8I949_VANTA|nr:sorting nexin-4-like [Vanessa tameamea]XP_047528564.1 sorting nexin-4-like [Vanessa atalanta]